VKDLTGKLRFVAICVLALFSFAKAAGGENLIFQKHLETVTRLELELRLFDYQVNRLEILSPARSQYLSRILSVTGKNTITSMFYVLPTIMRLKVDERKQKIADLCNSLFEEYQNRFWMTDTDYVKHTGEIGVPLTRMKPCNLAIHVYSEYPQPRLLAVWECGTVNYKKDFLKQ
jgi:hypothetical protein